jgi:hypothetical protein
MAMAHSMKRRQWLTAAAALPLLPGVDLWQLAAAGADDDHAKRPLSRVRPGDVAWPSEESWDKLGRAVEGRLIKVNSPVGACRKAPRSPACEELFKALRNPYYIAAHAGLTQTSGWVGAWTSQPSVYAVVARRTEDVVAAVNFARENNLRLVVRGGGHSYQGTSCVTDSLLVWTREMNAIALHQAFVGRGCPGLDPGDECDRAPPGVRRSRLRASAASATGRVGRSGRPLAPGV